MTSRFRLVLFLAYSLLVAGLLTRSGDLALAALPFMVYLAAGLLSASGEIRLAAVRRLSAPSAQPGAPLRMQVEVENQAQTTVYLHLEDAAHPGLEIMEGEREAHLALPPGEKTTLDYQFRLGRGSYAWQFLPVTAGDPFGLFERQLELACPDQVNIFPERIRIKHIPLFLQRTLQNPGPYRARRGGSGSDFWGVRPYHLGDPMRRIHWQLSARYPGSFFTKEFEREESADIGLILDAGVYFSAPGAASLFEHSASAAAALAEVLLKEGARLSVLNLNREERYLFPGSGKAQLVKVLRHLASAGSDANISLKRICKYLVYIFSRRSLIIVISPLRRSDVQAFRYMRATGYQVILLSPDPVSFASHSLPAGRAAELSLRAARMERGLSLRQVRQMGVEVIEWDVDQPLAEVLRSAFRSRRARRVGSRV
jgi:uncharacterized protein (DUF58 family)